MICGFDVFLQEGHPGGTEGREGAETERQRGGEDGSAGDG